VPFPDGDVRTSRRHAGVGRRDVKSQPCIQTGFSHIPAAILRHVGKSSGLTKGA
jgi:hypothetical protein